MKFKPEDFGDELIPAFSIIAARIANKKLDGWLKTATMVFSGPNKKLGKVTEEWTLAEDEGEDTHCAWLIQKERFAKV